MEVIGGIRALKRKFEHPVVTIGNFDGVHLGHRQIIQRGIEKARIRGGTSIIYTFRPHPQVALRPERPVTLLNTYEERLELFAELGPDLVIEEPFSREFSTLTAETFFSEYLIKRIQVESIVVGYDFGFGRRREGHLDSLERFCSQSGVELEVVPVHRMDEDVVSSSRIRQLLGVGDVARARVLLGYPFSYRGVVVQGEGRGRKIGVPTANLQVEPKIALASGVYATRVRVGSDLLPGVTNIGVRPTFKTDSVSHIETHILDSDSNFYGKTLQIQFFERLRDEKKFDSVDGLVQQIRQDIDTARIALSRPAS